ncbi:S8 family serine peptidase [Pseudonocardia sp. ICBG1293]|uniref:S8 family serine peptidase n=1 Tax=Pseudonocardia sp. ICBG1293 TaxID=2844382 RepID=UPI001CCA45C8|nr:S8 family serine peptidase [Pseudonocardia sp. ICBG1293]
MVAATVTALVAGAVVATEAAAQPADTEYTVLAERPSDLAAARVAVEDAGATVVRENPAVGLVVARGPATGFVERVAQSPAVLGAGRVRPIGSLPTAGLRTAAPAADIPGIDPVEQEHRSRPGPAPSPRLRTPAEPQAPGLDPLDATRFGMTMTRADAARAVEPGDRRVLVGVLDSGVDAGHPDLAGQLDTGLSRNFAPDIPTDPNGTPFDGPCEDPSCLDPVGRDDLGHGTHVAGIIAAAADGRGISGVAPEITLVDLRGGQDSGLLFLQPVVDALTHGADVGVDVINMSFGVDPWVYNCSSSEPDSAEARIEQQTVVATMDRTLRYVHERGVTLVGSMGNNYDDLGAPKVDRLSPTYPVGSAYPRPIDNATCHSLPVEGPFVLGVSSVGPSRIKADYSNYGIEQTDLAAPGGWLRDGLGTPAYESNENLTLSTFPKEILQAIGDVAPDGSITEQGQGFGVQRGCDATGGCGYYAYLQGTSMAAPHVAAAAALVVSRFGTEQPGGGFGMDPLRVEQILRDTAADRACPAPVLSYAPQGRGPEYDAPCVGTPERNGHYGDGIVDAYAAVTAPR